MATRTYKTTDNDGRVVLPKGGNRATHNFDDSDSAEDTDEGPQDHNYITQRPLLLRPVAKEAGDRVREVLPWCGGQPGIKVVVDLEMPFCRVDGHL